MGKISRKRRRENYYKVYGEIEKNARIRITQIAENTQITRNTVSKYLEQMYEKQIIRGPCLHLKPHENYKEYIYLMRFSDPYKAYKGLRGFPHVVYNGMAFGDWNTMVICDRLMDFSQLVGFSEMVYQGVKGFSYTPRATTTDWKKAFENAVKYLKSPPIAENSGHAIVPMLPWKKDEWNLFCAFCQDFRKPVIPLLKKIKVQYENYSEWLKTLEEHCTIHTGFYPRGYEMYMHYSFLFSTEYRDLVIKIFSLFPTSSHIMEVSDRLLVFASVAGSDAQRRLFCLIHHLRETKSVTKILQSVSLFYSINGR